MDSYRAFSQSNRNFSLVHKDSLIGKLVYPNWFSGKADLIIDGKKVYEFVKKGFWSKRLELQQNGRVLIALQPRWRWVDFRTYFHQTEQNYILKLNSFFNNQYVLLDNGKNELASFNSEFQWKKLKNDYTIITTAKFDTLENKELLLFSILYYINYQKQTNVDNSNMTTTIS
jgi:hypothetical protein